MTKRETTIALARVAGYHEDKKTFTRLYVEGRVNLGIMNAAFHSGRQAKKNGVKCNCYDCKESAGQDRENYTDTQDRKNYTT